MNLAPILLEHGERFGKLVVLRKRGQRYSVGCECGYRLLVRAKQLMSGRVKACRKCASASTR